MKNVRLVAGFASQEFSETLQECKVAEADSQFYQGRLQLTSAESKITNSLASAAEELAHTECFDHEQISEIYAILGAIKTDTENHRRMIELVADKVVKGVGDA